MRKQVLVSVDRGETRVALMEATGHRPPRPSRAGRRAAPPPRPPAQGRLPRRRALPRAPRQPLHRRQHLQGQGRQRPARARGGVRRHRPRQERLPARRRDRAAGRRGRAPRPRGRLKGKKIGELLKPGQEVVVQVVKDPLKTKGARLSMELTIAGRYMVYTPTGEGIGVSKRLDDKERERLRSEAKGLDLQGRRRDRPHGRAGRQARGLRARAAVPLQAPRGPREARRGGRRRRRWSSRRPTSRCASCATSSASDFERAIVDDEQQHHRLVSFFSRTAPELVDRVELYGRSPSRCSRRTASRRSSTA